VTTTDDDWGLADVLQDALTTPTRKVEYQEDRLTGSEQNVVDGLFAIAAALNRVATALQLLADGSVSPRMGDALEGLASLKYRE